VASTNSDTVVVPTPELSGAVVVLTPELSGEPPKGPVGARLHAQSLCRLPMGSSPEPHIESYVSPFSKQRTAGSLGVSAPVVNPGRNG